MIPLKIRRELIETGDSQMSICKQCELLSVSRSTHYYRPSRASDKDIGFMQELDKLCQAGNEKTGKVFRKELLHGMLFRNTGSKMGYPLSVFLNMQETPTIYI